MGLDLEKWHLVGQRLQDLWLSQGQGLTEELMAGILTLC